MSSTPSVPYLCGWSFPSNSDAGLHPKVPLLFTYSFLVMMSCPYTMCVALHQICVQTSTSAGLEQILAWLFYHKVIGVA